MPKIKVNDITLYYEILGQGEPIVFVAGFTADHTLWLPVAELLKANYQVILLDNRGAGQSDAPEGPYSIEQMADDVVACCSQLGINKAHVVGSSMGGYIAQMIAYRHPAFVKKVILSNSALNTHCVFHLYVEAQLKLRKANVPAAILSQASCSWAFSYRFLSQPGMLEDLIQQSVNNPFPFGLTGYEGQYAALDRFDSSAWARKIAAEVLVMGGEQDLIFSESRVKALAAQIPHAEYYGFKECGHLPMLEFPKQFCDKVVTFLQK